MNPLLSDDPIPHFATIEPQHIAPAIHTLLETNAAILKQVLANSQDPNWENFVQPLEEAHARLSRIWGLISHLNSVINTPALRDAYNDQLPLITQYWSELAQNSELYVGYQRLANSAQATTLSPARRRILSLTLRDFRLGGAELPAAEKQRFLALQETLANTAARFEQNLLDTMNAFSYCVDRLYDLRGLPEPVIAAARSAAVAEGFSGWKLTLHAPCYIPVMQYAEARELRELFYTQYGTRASEQGNPEWDNAPLIERILQCRNQEAELLGFSNFAELSLATKMADSPQVVMEFLRDLAHRARPFAQREWQELQNFARDRLGLATVEPWDMAWIAEKLRQDRYDFSEQEVRTYFPEHKVIDGLFDLIAKLYGIKALPLPGHSAWHEDARLYQLQDGTGSPLGQFYLDLYARPGKRGGAWMDNARSRQRTAAGLNLPMAYLTCNFSRPVGDQPATFTHDEVITLFHEFGHGLHHLLTEVEEWGVSGIQGVEWDAVELPSQFMENFCWDWDTLVGLSGHVTSAEPLPRSLYERMLAARHFHSGLGTLRQIEFALFDLVLHQEHSSGRTPLEVLQQIRSEVAVVQPPHWHRFPNSFAHIFAGGYAAGYYSYKWAEVLSADAFSLFEENGLLNPATGERFRQEVLATGGSRPAMDSYIAFRGRKPTIDALLRQHGLVEAISDSPEPLRNAQTETC